MLYAASALPTVGFMEYAPNEAAPLIDDYGRLHQPQVSFSASKEGRYENGFALGLPIYTGSTSSDANKESVENPSLVTLYEPFQSKASDGSLVGLEITGSFGLISIKRRLTRAKAACFIFSTAPANS